MASSSTLFPRCGLSPDCNDIPASIQQLPNGLKDESETFLPCGKILISGRTFSQNGGLMGRSGDFSDNSGSGQAAVERVLGASSPIRPPEHLLLPSKRPEFLMLCESFRTTRIALAAARTSRSRRGCRTLLNSCRLWQQRPVRLTPLAFRLNVPGWKLASWRPARKNCNQSPGE